MRFLFVFLILPFAACDINLNQENTNCVSTLHCDDESERFCDRAEPKNADGQCVNQVCYLNYSEYCVETIKCFEKDTE